MDYMKKRQHNIYLFQNSAKSSEDEAVKESLTPSNIGAQTAKLEQSRLTIPPNPKCYNTSKHRLSSSSISPLKSIPESTSNGATEIEIAENENTSSSNDNITKISTKSTDSNLSLSTSLLGVMMPKGPSVRSASLHPPNENDDETEMSLFNRRQSGEFSVT